MIKVINWPFSLSIILRVLGTVGIVGALGTFFYYQGISYCVASCLRQV